MPQSRVAVTDQPDKDPADMDETTHAPPSEEPETSVVASDTTTVDRDELAWSLDDTDDELKAEHRSWTDTWKTTAMILACAALVAAMVGGLIWGWHAVNRHSAAPPTPTLASTPSAAAPTPSAPAPTPSPPAPSADAFVQRLGSRLERSPGHRAGLHPLLGVLLERGALAAALGDRVGYPSARVNLAEPVT
jgi:hypothetical protein